MKIIVLCPNSFHSSHKIKVMLTVASSNIFVMFSWETWHGAALLSLWVQISFQITTHQYTDTRLTLELVTEVREVFTITFNKENPLALAGAFSMIVKLQTFLRFQLYSSNSLASLAPLLLSSSPPWLERSIPQLHLYAFLFLPWRRLRCGPLRRPEHGHTSASPQYKFERIFRRLHVRNAISQFWKEILSSGLRALGARSECWVVCPIFICIIRIFCPMLFNAT